jgi:molybdenum cofactor synthesis domain-containing protein
VTDATLRTAAALVIGNELLTGKTADSNVVLLAKAMRAVGIVLDRVVIVPDTCDVIAEEVRSLSASHDVVFTSGGMGPTHDDVTVEAVALAFDVPVVVPDDLDRLLRSHYGDRINESHLRMARVPEGAKLVRRDGAGWPTIVMRNVWLLPGVPHIFARKMALVRAELGGAAPFASLAVRTRLDECTIKPMLDRVVEAHPHVEVGSYPRWIDRSYHTEITFDARAEADAVAARDAFVAVLPPDTLLGADE